MSSRHRKPRPRWTLEDYKARFAAERERQLERYGRIFEVWRGCTQKRCRRMRACQSEVDLCLFKMEPSIPHKLQWWARALMLGATPDYVGGPERAAREFTLRMFFEEGAPLPKGLRLEETRRKERAKLWVR